MCKGMAVFSFLAHSACQYIVSLARQQSMIVTQFSVRTRAQQRKNKTKVLALLQHDSNNAWQLYRSVTSGPPSPHMAKWWYFRTIGLKIGAYSNAIQTLYTQLLWEFRHTVQHDKQYNSFWIFISAKPAKRTALIHIWLLRRLSVEPGENYRQRIGIIPRWDTTWW